MKNDVESVDPITILIVDDNASNRMLAKRTIAKYFQSIKKNIDVMEVESGAGARDRVNENIKQFNKNFNIIIMDGEMPGMNGKETTGQIRQVEDESSLPLDQRAFIIPWSTADSFHHYDGANVLSGVLAKPIDLKSFEQVYHDYENFKVNLYLRKTPGP